MIYILAVLFPPLALLLESKWMAAVLALFFCLCAALVFFPLYLLVGVYACVAIASRRKAMRHSELVSAVRGGR